MKKPFDLQREVFFCECSDPSHIFEFVFSIWDYDPTKEDKLGIGNCEVYFQAQLNHYLPWYKRFWLSVKYVLGFYPKPGYSHWDGSLLRMKDVIRLRRLLQGFEKFVSEHPESIPEQDKKEILEEIGK